MLQTLVIILYTELQWELHSGLQRNQGYWVATDSIWIQVLSTLVKFLSRNLSASAIKQDDNAYSLWLFWQVNDVKASASYTQN